MAASLSARLKGIKTILYGRYNKFFYSNYETKMNRILFHIKMVKRWLSLENVPKKHSIYETCMVHPSHCYQTFIGTYDLNL